MGFHETSGTTPVRRKIHETITTKQPPILRTIHEETTNSAKHPRKNHQFDKNQRKTSNSQTKQRKKHQFDEKSTKQSPRNNHQFYEKPTKHPPILRNIHEKTTSSTKINEKLPIHKQNNEKNTKS